MKCPLCGSKETTLLYKKETFNILRCPSCGFVFNERWAELSDEVRSVPGTDSRLAQIAATFDREKEVYFERFRKELARIDSLKDRGKILDIGCAYGYFLVLAKEDGWQAHGIDVDKSSVDYCRQHHSLDVAHGGLKEGHFPERSFDVIMMFHVLEHIPDFHDVMLNAKRMLKDDGLLVIDVPNVADLRRSLFKQEWFQFKEHHLWYFSKKTIRFLLQKYGLRILTIHPHGGSQLAFALDKTFKTNISRMSAKHFKFLKGFRDIFLKILNSIGFSEDITVYAQNTGH